MPFYLRFYAMANLIETSSGDVTQWLNWFQNPTTALSMGAALVSTRYNCMIYVAPVNSWLYISGMTKRFVRKEPR